MRSKRQNFWIIFILGTLTALGPFSIDMYLPAFPDIALDLKTDVASVAISLSSFFVGISLGQLVYGPLLDRFGRKKPLYYGLALYILTSLGCLFIHTIDGLIVLRFLQALGSCAAAVASMAMVRDFFPVKDSAKVFSLLILVLGTSPLVAPTVGGYVTAIFGWHSVFIILSVMAFFMMLAVALALPDKHKPDASISLKLKPIFKNYLTVLKIPPFYTYTFTGAIAFCGLFAYVAGSPMVFMDIYQLDAKTFGWIFAFLSVGFISASQVNSFLLRRFESQQIAMTALIVQTMTAYVFLVFVLNAWITLPLFIMFLFIVLACVGFTAPNTSALALAPFSKYAGSASALMGAVQMGLGAITSLLLGFLNTKTSLPMVVTMCISSTLALLIIFIGGKTKASAVHMLHEL
ncbi:MAG: multidrug effflux MFS transporter [Bdellovibrio sp.]|nr:multidrug effflux MFS transporter [Bdellovibrio sp.]